MVRTLSLLARVKTYLMGGGDDVALFGLPSRLMLVSEADKGLSVANLLGDKTYLRSVEKLQFADKSTSASEILEELQGRFSSIVVSATKNAGQYVIDTEYVLDLADDTGERQTIWFDGKWSDSFRSDVQRFLNWSANSPLGDAAIGRLDLETALGLVAAGVSGPSFDSWERIIGLLADFQPAADGNMSFDSVLTPPLITELRVLSLGSSESGGLKYLSALENVESPSTDSETMKVVKRGDTWTASFSQDVESFLAWARASNYGDPGLANWTTAQGLLFVEDVLKANNATGVTIIGMLADFSVSANGQMEFDGLFV